jgi:hypothetical protein
MPVSDYNRGESRANDNKKLEYRDSDIAYRHLQLDRLYARLLLRQPPW